MARSRNRNKTKTKINTATPKSKYGLIPLNNLTYGNPDAAQDILVRKEGTFDYIANHYMDKPYPNNDGNYAQQELEQIRKDMQKLQHENIVDLSIKFDEDLQGAFLDAAQKCGVPNASEFIKELMDDINPIIMKLKFYYNRIRPFQLANVLSFPLNPMPTVSAQSPSYPSGHTVQSRVFADVLSFRYPDQQNVLDEMADKCSKSRIILGVHFPSDEIFGKQLAAGIVKDENFRKKYFDAKKIKEGVSDSPIKNYARNNPESGIPEFVNRNPQPRQGADLYTPPKTVNEDEIFGGMPKAPEGGMPFPGAPR